MFFRRFALALALLGFPVSAPAGTPPVTIYDTFQFGTGDPDAAPLGQVGSFDFQAAYPFTAPAGALSLDSITVSLWTDVDVNTPNGDWLLRLRENDDATDEPGAVLEEWTLQNTATPGATTIHEFVSVVRPTFVADERYWVNMKTVPGSGFAAWNGSQANTTDMFSARQGSLNPDWMAPSTPYLLALVTVVPEPGQSLLLAAGAAVLAVFARRGRRG